MTRSADIFNVSIQCKTTLVIWHGTLATTLVKISELTFPRKHKCICKRPAHVFFNSCTAPQTSVIFFCRLMFFTCTSYLLIVCHVHFHGKLCAYSCTGRRVDVATNTQRLQQGVSRSSCALRGKRRTTPTAVSAQPTEKAVDVGKGTTDPLLLRTARGEVTYVTRPLSYCSVQKRLPGSRYTGIHDLSPLACISTP